MMPILMGFERMVELIIAGILAGLLGALAGLGGGVVLTPSNAILRYIIIYASGSSLISAISTSAGSASVYVRRLANDRISISLTTATTTSVMIGSLVANYVYTHNLTWIIYVVFGTILIISIIPTVQRGTY